MINVGSYIIVQKIGGEHLRLCRVKKGEKILIEKLRFIIDGALGAPYGLFEASAGKICPVVLAASTSAKVDVNRSGVEEKFLKGNNGQPPTVDVVVEVTDEGSGDITAEEQPRKRQKLTDSDISLMKDAGVSTGELISKLVDGNQRFQERTEFSQLKYREKKTKKHSDRVLILKPTVRLLSDSYYKRDPERIGHLRIDLLGHLLQLSGVRVGSRVFVYEQALGLLGAAVLERLAGKGACVFLHRYQVPQSISSIFAMEFGEKELSAFLPLRLTSFLEHFKRRTSTLTATSTTFTTAPDVESSTATVVPLDGDHSDKSKSTPAASGTTTFDDDVMERDVNIGDGDDRPTDDDEEAAVADKSSNNGAETERRRQERAERETTAIRLMRPGAGGFDDVGALDAILLAVSSTDAEDLLERVYVSLRLSGTVVVHSSVRDQIINVYNWLRKSGAVDVQVTDHFCRQHQVLPDRTHPLMRQTIPGGYLLSATKVRPV